MIVWVSVVLKRTFASEIDVSIICAEVIVRVKVNCDILYYQLLVFSLWLLTCVVNLAADWSISCDIIDPLSVNEDSKRDWCISKTITQFVSYGHNLNSKA